MAHRKSDLLTDYARRLLLERYDGTTGAIDELVRLLGVPRQRIHSWARRLGLTRKICLPWTAAEDAYLEEWAARLPVEQMARHLGRSWKTVRQRMDLLGATKQRAGYTVASLASALGCSEAPIRDWIARGWLKATRRQSERTSAQGGDFWLITDDQLVEFVLRHGEAMRVHWTQIRWNWLISVLRGGRKTLRTVELDEERAG